MKRNVNVCLPAAKMSSKYDDLNLLMERLLLLTRREFRQRGDVMF